MAMPISAHIEAALYIVYISIATNIGWLKGA
jgi:hypothetical protein